MEPKTGIIHYYNPLQERIQIRNAERYWRFVLHVKRIVCNKNKVIGSDWKSKEFEGKVDLT